VERTPGYGLAGRFGRPCSLIAVIVALFVVVTANDPCDGYRSTSHRGGL
jgi:hypothetical protein